MPLAWAIAPLHSGLLLSVMIGQSVHEAAFYEGQYWTVIPVEDAQLLSLVFSFSFLFERSLSSLLAQWRARLLELCLRSPVNALQSVFRTVEDACSWHVMKRSLFVAH